VSRLAKILVKDCEFSVRTHNCLWRWKMNEEMTLHDLDLISDEELLAIPACGRKSLREIREAISSAKAAQLPIARVHLYHELHDLLSAEIESGRIVNKPLADLLARLS